MEGECEIRMGTLDDLLDAPYYLDLLSLISSLKIKSSDYFSKIQEFTLGFKHNPQFGEDKYLFAGSEQVTEFMKEFKINQKLINHLKCNPLFQKFDLSFMLEAFDIRYIQLKMLNEGTYFSPYKPYGKLITTEFYFNLVAPTIMRICEFQTLNATEAARIKANKIILGTQKLQNTTVSAYMGRALEIAGVYRFLSPQEGHFQTISSKQWRESLGFNGWNVKSNEVVNLMNRKKRLVDVGFSESIADELWNNKIFAIHKSEYELNHLIGFAIGGSVPNEIMTGMNQRYLEKSINPRLNSEFYLVDSYYQHIFNPINPLPIALYGQSGKEVPNTLKKYEWHSVSRAKRRVIPKIIVRNVTQIEDIVNSLKEELENNHFYFRGQNRHRKLPRSNQINEFLYGNKDVDEISLLTSASRTNFNFDRFFALFQLQIQGSIYNNLPEEDFKEPSIWDSLYPPKAPFKNDSIEKLYHEWRFQYNSFEWDNTITGLAQHYGIPTHGLDITDDLNIALWFALNKYFDYTEGEKKYSWFKPLEVTGDKIDDLPVIYIISTDKVRNHELNGPEYLNLSAARPRNQRAFLHYGGWGLHTNICAEDVVAALFLSPDFSPPALPSTEFIFPNEENDPFYKELITIKKNMMSINDPCGFENILEYKKPSYFNK